LPPQDSTGRVEEVLSVVVFEQGLSPVILRRFLAMFYFPGVLSSVNEGLRLMSDLKKIKKMVMVDICQAQSLNGYDPFEIEEEALGSLYQVDKDTYILAYDTLLREKKITTTVKITKNSVSVVKIGDVHSRQTFAVNEWYASQYFYGGGSLVCRNFTKKLDYALTPEGGIIEILYELWSGDTHLGYFNLELFIR
jgi:uncharacterized beta-barrel protein YwiB (DUF1934 family)